MLELYHRLFLSTFLLYFSITLQVVVPRVGDCSDTLVMIGVLHLVIRFSSFPFFVSFDRMEMSPAAGNGLLDHSH